MCVISKPAMRMNSSPLRCGEVPMPDEPNVTSPLFALARAISSLTDFAGEVFGTTRMLGNVPISVIGAKSATAS